MSHACTDLLAKYYIVSDSFDFNIKGGLLCNNWRACLSSQPPPRTLCIWPQISESVCVCVLDSCVGWVYFESVRVRVLYSTHLWKCPSQERKSMMQWLHPQKLHTRWPGSSPSRSLLRNPPPAESGKWKKGQPERGNDKWAFESVRSTIALSITQPPRFSGLFCASSRKNNDD
jgi:hypothetical protein